MKPGNVDRMSIAAKQALAAEDAPVVFEVLQCVYDKTGIDFREYAFASIRRRVLACMQEEGVPTVTDLRNLVCESDAALGRILNMLTLPVTSMFRDPHFYAEFREFAVPLLRTHPFLRLWVAGCSTGQEVYSLAILLHEEGLHERSRIYATDLQPRALEQAKSGIFPVAVMQDYTRNYHTAGGTAAFSDYYTSDGHAVLMRPFLKKNVTFGMHNLATDQSFNEFQVIFCRNVMIYFSAPLQARVHCLFYDSLAPLGYLGLGRGETIRFSPHEERYEAVSARERLYRKTG